MKKNGSLLTRDTRTGCGLYVLGKDLDLYRAWFWNGPGAAASVAVPAATAAAAAAAVVAHVAASTAVVHRNSENRTHSATSPSWASTYATSQSRSGIISGGGSFGRS